MTTSLLLNAKFLLIIPKTWFPFLAAAAHCWETFRDLRTMTPRSFSSVVSLRSTFPIWYVCPGLWNPKCMTPHLSALYRICQSSAQFCKWLMSSCISSMTMSSLVATGWAWCHLQICWLLPSCWLCFPGHSCTWRSIRVPKRSLEPQS